MDKKEVDKFLKEFKANNKNGMEIFEILEKGSKVFVNMGTPGYYDSCYVMVDIETKKVKPVDIFKYFKSSSEMDKYVIYSKKGG